MNPCVTPILQFTQSFQKGHRGERPKYQKQKSNVKIRVRNRTVLTKGRFGDWSDWMFETAP